MDASCALDEGAHLRTAKPRGLSASTLARTRDNASHCAGTVTKKPDRRRERGVSRKPIVQETPDDLALPVVTLLVCFFHSHARLRVWLNTRRFLRPLSFGAAVI